MATYLVIPTTKADADSVDAPARRSSGMGGLAIAAKDARYGPRWLRAWSADLYDDRPITLWDAVNAAEIEAALKRHGFLDQADVLALRVKE